MSYFCVRRSYFLVQRSSVQRYLESDLVAARLAPLEGFFVLLRVVAARGSAWLPVPVAFVPALPPCASALLPVARLQMSV